MKNRFASTAVLPLLVAAVAVVGSACGGGDFAPTLGDGSDAAAAPDAADPDASAPSSPPPVEGIPGRDAATNDIDGSGSDTTTPLSDASSNLDGRAATDAGPPVDPCTLLRPDAATSVFVAPGGGASPGCGSIDKPCGGVQDAIELAAKGAKPTVIVAAGTYAKEVINLRPGLTLQGGWNRSAAGAWSKECGASPSALVTLRAPASADRTVVASFAGAAAAATLDTLSIESKPFADRGQTLYGVFVTGASTKLVLNAVSVTVADGGAGADGKDTLQGGPAPNTCTASSTGQTALVPGADGAGAPRGTFGVAGYVGLAAGDGAPGSAGSNGAIPSPVPVTGPGCTLGGFQLAGSSVAGAPPPCDTTAVSVRGNPGTAGCGGAGGGGGIHGSNGGSSISVFVADGAVTAAGGKWVAGSGGVGGNGGKGAAGSQGGPVGVQGAPSDPNDTSATYYGVCTPVTSGATGRLLRCDGSDPHPAPPGAPGGAGGNGSAGGGGGGGSGGISYAYVTAGSGMVSSATTQLGFGAPGAGGSGGAAGTPRNPGAAGGAAPHN